MNAGGEIVEKLQVYLLFFVLVLQGVYTLLKWILLLFKNAVAIMAVFRGNELIE